MKLVALLLSLLLAACSSTPLFVTEHGVSIYLVDEPEVAADSYRIKFQFESPTDDPNIIQQIELDGYTGIESFRVGLLSRTGTDTHHQKSVQTQNRRMTLMPGEVRGTDERNGFAMLPSNWPPLFNADYLKAHKIQGKIVKMRPEASTVYHLDFERGKLIWYIEDTDIRMEWNHVESEAEGR